MKNGGLKEVTLDEFFTLVCVAPVNDKQLLDGNLYYYAHDFDFSVAVIKDHARRSQTFWVSREYFKLDEVQKMIPNNMVEVTRSVFCKAMDDYILNGGITSARFEGDFIIYEDVFLHTTLGHVNGSAKPNIYCLLKDLVPNKKPDNEVSGLVVKHYDIEWDD